MNLQFDEIKIKAVNFDGSVVVSGLASTSSLDGDNERMIITPNALENALPAFREIGSPVKVEHGKNIKYGDEKVGTVNNFEYLDKENFNLDNPVPKPTQISVVATITDPQASQEVLNKILGGFSIGVRVKKSYNENGLGVPGIFLVPNTGYQILTNIEILELTICKTPKNKDCFFKIVENNDQNILTDYVNKIGEKVKAYDLNAEIINYATNEEGKKFYQLDFEGLKLKSVFVEEGKLKAGESKVENIIEKEKALDGQTSETGKGLVQTNTQINPNPKKFYTKVLEKKHLKSLNEKENSLDEVYKKYQSLTNMGASELENWSKSPYSRLASLSRTPLTRNLILKEKPKAKWTTRDVKNANRTIAFVSRMKNAEQGKNLIIDGKDIGMSKKDIALKNWAYNPTKTKAQPINPDPIPLKKSTMFDTLLKPLMAKLTELNPEAKDIKIDTLELENGDKEVYATIDEKPLVYSIVEKDGDFTLIPVTSDDEEMKGEGDDEAKAGDKSEAEKPKMDTSKEGMEKGEMPVKSKMDTEASDKLDKIILAIGELTKLVTPLVKTKGMEGEQPKEEKPKDKMDEPKEADKSYANKEKAVTKETPNPFYIPNYQAGYRTFN